MMCILRLSVCLVLAALAGCSVTPAYVKPKVTVPAGWEEDSNWQRAQPQQAASQSDWWAAFGDPVLDELMRRIDINNQSLKASAAQYRQARALADQARAGFYPTVSGTVSTGRSRTPGVGIGNSHSLSLDASWETDLWGRIDATAQAARATAQASADDLAAARLSLQAALAQDYFQLRVLDAQKALFAHTLADDEKSLTLTRNQYAAGIVTRADVAQAQTQLASTRAQAVDLEVFRTQLAHAIAVLVGEPPATFTLPPSTARLEVPALPGVLPSALLERRPDIAAAERRVAAANAQIGVARAALYPDLTLTANAGLSSSHLANWISAPSRVWGLGAALAQSIFDGGNRQAAVAAAQAGYDATVAQYRQTVLGAFQEVEDNLSALHYLQQEADQEQQAVAASIEAQNLAENQYKAGTVSYLNVVTAQTTALANQRTALQILGRRLSASALLIKAAGGGWQVADRPH